MPAAATAVPISSGPRLWALDRLKVVLTFMVIAHHVGQGYGATGGFWAYQNPERWLYLGFLFWVNSSFFMGLFFFISAYFVPGSYDRKGGAAFLKDKLIRFGLPLVIYELLINPVQMYVSYINYRGGTLPFLTYYIQIYLGMAPKPDGFQGPIWPDINFGHLWFVQHLLFYAAGYALWRLVSRSPATHGPARTKADAPGDLAILGYAISLTVATLLVRTRFPIDDWLTVPGFIMGEPAHLPQYLSLFVLGTIAVRRGWFQAMPRARGLRWLWVGLVAALAGGLVRYHLVPFPPAAWGLLLTTSECFLAAGFVVGLCTLFRERFNTTTPFWQMLGTDAFGAYLVHVPIVVALQYATSAMPAGPVPKFLLVTFLSIPLSFMVSHYLRRIPGVERVL